MWRGATRCETSRCIGLVMHEAGHGGRMGICARESGKRETGNAESQTQTHVGPSCSIVPATTGAHAGAGAAWGLLLGHRSRGVGGARGDGAVGADADGGRDGARRHARGRAWLAGAGRAALGCSYRVHFGDLWGRGFGWCWRWWGLSRWIQPWSLARLRSSALVRCCPLLSTPIPLIVSPTGPRLLLLCRRVSLCRCVCVSSGCLFVFCLPVSLSVCLPAPLVSLSLSLGWPAQSKRPLVRVICGAAGMK